MVGAILSTCLLDITLPEEEHCKRLTELVRKMNDELSLGLVWYDGSPNSNFENILPQYTSWISSTMFKTNIYPKLQKMLGEYYYVDIRDSKNVECLTNAEFPRNSETDNMFKCIDVLNRSDKDFILFVGDRNMKCDRPFKFKSDFEFNVDVSHLFNIETSSVLSKCLRDTSVDGCFPRKEFCKDYNDYVKDLIRNEKMDQSQKNALFAKIGDVVALYNGYVKDIYLTKLNNRGDKIRHIYKKSFGKLFYLSIDYESGGFEVFDEKYRHLGQFDFSGNNVKRAEPNTHKLIVK